MKQKIILGVENLAADFQSLLGKQRVGLVCNQASVNHQYEHAADFLQKSGVNLTVLFSPQHGIRGTVQDNMIESPHGTDATTGLTVFSLYSETRIPTAEMVSDIDCFVIDLFDIGTRVYTFIYTMANCMQAAALYGKKVYICDRPNPIDGVTIEGDLLLKGHESFVGMYPIPMRHGLTIGELALFFNKECGIGCELEVIPMSGWNRELYFDETDAPWVMPSPNMPTVDTACVFPGTVYFEGTQISEGRGTTRPFEIVGAPHINSDKLAKSLRRYEFSGVVFQPWDFRPTFQKYAGENCGGVFLHVTDRRAFQSVGVGIALVSEIYHFAPEQFKWKVPPYEYVFDRNPFDVIAGNENLRQAVENKSDVRDIIASWQTDERDFRQKRSEYLLY